MKEPIQLSEEEIAILMDLLEKVQERGLNLIDHPGEIKAIWNIEAELEKVSVLAFDKDYNKKVAFALDQLWNAKLIKIDLREIESKKDLLSIFKDEMKFPDYFGFNWDAFDECLQDYCKANYLVLIIGANHIGPGLEMEIETMKKCFDEFNKSNEFKIEIME